MSADDQRDAARHLIRQPLVLAARDPEGHRRIRRNADALATMVRTYLGYRLVVEPGGPASLGAGEKGRLKLAAARHDVNKA